MLHCLKYVSFIIATIYGFMYVDMNGLNQHVLSYVCVCVYMYNFCFQNSLCVH